VVLDGHHRPAAAGLPIVEMLPPAPPAHVDATIERLTFTAGRSCRTPPLAELQGTIVVCLPLISPRAIDATLWDPPSGQLLLPPLRSHDGRVSALIGMSNPARGAGPV
jgi:hypothetical protein